MITEFMGRALDRFQQEAIEALNEGFSVLVAAPTGTGKTLVADYLVQMIEQQGKRVVFTAPIKALSNQKFRDYTRMFGSDKVGLITGDLVVNQEAPIVIMTTEILRNILLQSSSTLYAPRDEEFDPALVTASTARVAGLSEIGAVIIDEIHFLGDPYRGTVWEELLIYLPTTIQILGLSATLSNLNAFAEWLSRIRNSEVKVIREDTRSVPLTYFLANSNIGCVPLQHYRQKYADLLNHHIFLASTERKNMKPGQKPKPAAKPAKSGKHGRHGKYGRPKQPGRGGCNTRDTVGFPPPSEPPTSHIDVVSALKPESFPLLYFIYSRKLTENYAYRLSRMRPPALKTWAERPSELSRRVDQFAKDNPGLLKRDQIQTFKLGIAYHHAGVHVALKAFIEELYEERLLAVLYCTSTFALGVNMPARSVVFDSMTRYNGQKIVPLESREFMQMAGRAGRRGIDSFGHVIIRMPYNQWKQDRPTLDRILKGEEEPVTSSFNLSYNSVLHLITQHDESRIREILNASFKAFELEQAVAKYEHNLTKIDGEDDSFEVSRERAYLKRSIARAKRPILWEQFQKKLTFLRSYNYISPNNELYAPGKICIRIQFAEIIVTELFLAGIFESIPVTMVFGILTGLVQNLPRAALVVRPENKEWYDVFRRIGEVYQSEIVQTSQKLLPEPETLCMELMPLGELWAQGHSLPEIMGQIRHETDLSGDLVGAFRRAKDLLGQLREVVYEDPHQRAEYTQLLRQVSRDEVDAVG